jgi:hypothetical protein
VLWAGGAAATLGIAAGAYGVAGPLGTIVAGILASVVTPFAIKGVDRATLWARPDTSTPFTVNLVHTSPRVPNGPGWVFPNFAHPTNYHAERDITALEDLNQPNCESSDLEGTDSWALAQGAVRGAPHVIRLYLQAASADASVVITGIEFASVTRHQYDYQSVVWDAYLYTRGIVDVHGLRLVIDGPHPSITPFQTSSRAIPAALPLSITSVDVACLELHVARIAEPQCVYEWTLNIHWTSKGHSGTLHIDDGGQPFRTASTAHAVRVNYDVSQPRGYRWENTLRPRGGRL